jgi:Bacterial toxin 30
LIVLSQDPVWSQQDDEDLTPSSEKRQCALEILSQNFQFSEERSNNHVLTEVLLVTQLIDNRADLRDIAANSQILLDGSVRVDLVSGWLKNGTHLKDAIAIMSQRVNLNLIGTSKNKIGDFTGLTGTPPNHIISRIPENAKILPWKPGRITQGMKFEWTDESGQDWEVKMHGPDINATVGSNAASGWVLRVRYGKEYMDVAGTFYSQKALYNPRSPYYNPTAANDTHMPIQQP